MEDHLKSTYGILFSTFWKRTFINVLFRFFKFRMPVFSQKLKNSVV